MSTRLKLFGLASFLLATLAWPARGAAEVPEGLLEVPQSGMTATASGTNGTDVPGKAIDEDAATYWRSASATAPQWIQLDLGRRRLIGAIEVYASTYRIRGYAIYISEEPDPADWGTAVVTGEFANSSDWQCASFDPASGRYLRLVATSRWSNYFYLHEMRVYEHPGLLADQQTGNRRFTNANTVDVTDFFAYDGYTHFQITENGAAPDDDPGSWTFTNSPPGTFEFATPGEDATVALTFWYTNLTQTVALRSCVPEINYATAHPTLDIRNTLTRYLLTGHPTVELLPEEVDLASTPGEFKGESIGFYEFTLACASDTTPALPIVSLDSAGVYEVAFTAINNAGNSSTATCMVTVVDYQATTRTWTGAGANALASTAANWTDDTAPVNDDHVLFDDSHYGNAQTNITWDLDVALMSWTQTADYNGIVTIQTKYPGQGSFTNLVINGNVSLLGGTWTHEPNPVGNTEINHLHVEIGQDFTLGTNAFVNVDGKGYAAGNYGPGRCPIGGSWYDMCGASHGGWDGEHQAFGPYGSVFEPVNLGSSGSSWPGGGAVSLKVTGISRVEGDISAIGECVGAGESYNAGAGGSILLRAGTIIGSGLLSVRGGNAYHGGTGGGGRIAMLVTHAQHFGQVRTMAGGGWNDGGNFRYNEASAGTIYQQHQGHQPGKGILTIAGRHRAYLYFMPHCPVTDMPPATETQPAVNLDDFSRIIISGQGNLGISGDTIMTNWDPTRFEVSGAENSFITVRNTNHVAFPAQMVVSNYSLHLDVPVKAAGNWTVTANGNLAHNFYGNLDLTLDGNLTVDADSMVSAHRRGYRSMSRIPESSTGPGGSSGGYTSGASHGGRGSYRSETGAFLPTYGSVLGPTNWGSQKSDYRGGGAVKLNVSGTLTLNGSVDADGDMTLLSSSYGSSAGGSVWLRAGTFAGAASVHAFGGKGNVSSGGGRISLIETSGAGLEALSCDVSSGGNSSAPGTIYRQPTGVSAGAGTVTVTAAATWNPGTTEAGTNTYCELPPAVLSVPDELRHATLQIAGRGRVGLSADLTVGDLFLVNGNPAFPQLVLNGHTLQVNSYYHKDWGDEAWVVYDGGQIVWKSGTLLMIR